MAQQSYATAKVKHIMKKIAVFLPVLPQPSYLTAIKQSLAFLDEAGYIIDFIDPCALPRVENQTEFYSGWQKNLSRLIPGYDAFLGFSFGGVILQNALALFESENKPIILFSTPTKVDEALKNKLNQVIHLCKQHHIHDALRVLYQFVYYPKPIPDQNFPVAEIDEAASRLSFGLQKVIDSDATDSLQRTTVTFTHMIGEQSNLVMPCHVFTPESGELVLVPDAGMRVLEDNLSFCRDLILSKLK